MATNASHSYASIMQLITSIVNSLYGAIGGLSGCVLLFVIVSCALASFLLRQHKKISSPGNVHRIMMHLHVACSNSVAVITHEYERPAHMPERQEMTPNKMYGQSNAVASIVAAHQYAVPARPAQKPGKRTADGNIVMEYNVGYGVTMDSDANNLQ